MGKLAIKFFGFFVIAIGVLYSAAWMAAAHFLEEGLASVTQHSNSKFSVEAHSVSGFPADMQIDLYNLAINDSQVKANIPTISASAFLLAPQEISWEIPQASQVSLQDRQSSQPTRYSLGTASGHVQLADDLSQLASLDASISNLSMRLPLLTPTGAPLTIDSPLTEMTVDLSLDPTASHAATVDLITNKLALPQLQSFGMARQIEKIDITARPTILPALPVNARNMARWRNNNGRVDIDFLEILWGGVKFTGNGRLNLDQNLQLEGEILGEISGYNELIDGLRKANLLKGREYTLLKAGLNLTAVTNTAGERVLKVNLQLRNQRLYYGQHQLMQLPGIRWN